MSFQKPVHIYITPPYPTVKITFFGCTSSTVPMTFIALPYYCRLFYFSKVGIGRLRNYKGLGNSFYITHKQVSTEHALKSSNPSGDVIHSS